MHRFVFHSSVCKITAKNNQPISLKLNAMIGPTNRKNCLTVGDDPVPDHFSTSLTITE